MAGLGQLWVQPASKPRSTRAPPPGGGGGAGAATGGGGGGDATTFAGRQPHDSACDLRQDFTARKTCSKSSPRAARARARRRAFLSRSASLKSLPGLGTWRLGGRDVRPDRVVCWAGSCSPSLLLESLGSLYEVLGSGLVLAERLGDGNGQSRQVHPPKTPPHLPIDSTCTWP
jgi:hypothetical protein